MTPEAFIVVPYDRDGFAEMRRRVDAVIREIWLRLEDAGFRSKDIEPVDIPGSFAGRPASQNWIIQVDKPGTIWTSLELWFKHADEIQQALEGVAFPSGSVLVLTDENGQESRRELKAPKRKLP